MEYRWIEDVRDFQNISQEWDQLLLDSNSDNPFLLSDFILTWWKYYYSENHLRMLVIYEGGKLIGGIPLYLRKEGWKRGFLKTLYYIGDGAANYTEPLFLSSKNFWSIFLNALEKRNDWDLLHLFNVRDQSNLVQEFNPRLLDSKISVNLIQDHLDWAIDLSQGLEKYQAQLSKNLKKDLKQKRRQAIECYGGLTLKEVSDTEEVKKYFDVYVNFSRQSFEARKEHSNFNDDSYVQFFKNFLVLMNQKSRLTTHILFVGDKVAAINFGYRFGKGLNCVLTAFNNEFRSLRPGYLLIEEIIKKAVLDRESYYNWYGHYTFYKSQVCNLSEPLYRIKVFKKNMYAYSLHYIEENIRHLRQSYVRQ